MCGPLCSASCQSQTKATAQFLLARIFIYSFWGLGAGLLGAFAFKIVSSEIHVAVSFFSAVLYLIYALFQIFAIPKNKKCSSKYRINIIKVINNSPFRSSVTAGLITGLLPCGFLSLALIQAMSVANPLKSALAMGAFAVASSPALWGGQKILFYFSKKYSWNLQKMTTYLMLITALALVSRVSLNAYGSEKAEVLCHFLYSAFQPKK